MKGWTIRRPETGEDWTHRGFLDLDAHITGKLGLALEDVEIDNHGIVITDTQGTGQRFFYYGTDLPSYIESNGWVNPKIEWQCDWEAGPECTAIIKAEDEREWAREQLQNAHMQILLHEDSDPTATATEYDWRAFRVAIRQYLHSNDKAIIAAVRPTAP